MSKYDYYELSRALKAIDKAGTNYIEDMTEVRLELSKLLFDNPNTVAYHFGDIIYKVGVLVEQNNVLEQKLKEIQNKFDELQKNTESGFINEMRERLSKALGVVTFKLSLDEVIGQIEILMLRDKNQLVSIEGLSKRNKELLEEVNKCNVTIAEERSGRRSDAKEYDCEVRRLQNENLKLKQNVETLQNQVSDSYISNMNLAISEALGAQPGFRFTWDEILEQIELLKEILSKAEINKKAITEDYDKVCASSLSLRRELTRILLNKENYADSNENIINEVIGLVKKHANLKEKLDTEEKSNDSLRNAYDSARASYTVFRRNLARVLFNKEDQNTAIDEILNAVRELKEKLRMSEINTASLRKNHHETINKLTNELSEERKSEIKWKNKVEDLSKSVAVHNDYERNLEKERLDHLEKIKSLEEEIESLKRERSVIAGIGPIKPCSICGAPITGTKGYCNYCSDKILFR